MKKKYRQIERFVIKYILVIKKTNSSIHCAVKEEKIYGKY